MANDKKQFNVNISRSNKSRYGADELSTFLVAAGFAVGIIATVNDMSSVGIGAVVFLLLACFRMSSRNISARRKENRQYLAVKHRVLSIFGMKAKGVSNAKSGSIKKEITCPSCSSKMNIPVGKGSIRVTCPSCKNKFKVQS